MKIASSILGVIIVALIAFNSTKIDFNALLEGESKLALIEIIAALIAVILLVVFMVSKKIEQKQD